MFMVSYFYVTITLCKNTYIIIQLSKYYDIFIVTYDLFISKFMQY